MGFEILTADAAQLGTRANPVDVEAGNALAEALRKLADGEAVSDGELYASSAAAHNAFMRYKRVLGVVNATFGTDEAPLVIRSAIAAAGTTVSVTEKAEDGTETTKDVPAYRLKMFLGKPVPPAEKTETSDNGETPKRGRGRPRKDAAVTA